MADIKISQLGEALAVTDNDILPMTASGVTSKVKASTMKDYMIGNNNISGLGDGTPTGAILNVKGASETADSNIEKTMAQNGAHNLCEFVAIDAVQDGVTFTVDTVNNIVTANNTSSGVVQFYELGTFTPSKTGSYILSGCTGGSDSTYAIRMLDYTDANYNFAYQYDDEITVTLTAGHKYGLRVHVYTSGISFSNQQFKPMIRLAEDTDTTYTPYAMTNRELTEELKPVIGGSFFTKATGGVIDQNISRAEKYGNIVVVHIAVKYASASSNPVLGTLSAYKPKLNVISPATLGSSSITVSIDASTGNITLSGNATTGAWTYANVVYVCE